MHLFIQASRELSIDVMTMVSMIERERYKRTAVIVHLLQQGIEWRGALIRGVQRRESLLGGSDSPFVLGTSSRPVLETASLMASASALKADSELKRGDEVQRIGSEDKSSLLVGAAATCSLIRATHR